MPYEEKDTPPTVHSVELPDASGEPLRITGWHPATGSVTVDVPPDHPAYAALLEGGTRGLSLPGRTLRDLAGELDTLTGALSKINLSENVQVAPVPAGNYAVNREDPTVDELPALTMSVNLSLTVPQEAVPATVARLSATLRDAVQEGSEDGWHGHASLSVYPFTDDDAE